MVNKYISEDGIFCIFKRCTFCKVDVLCHINGVPETHNKKCNKKHKLFKLKEIDKGVKNAKEKV